MMNLLYYGDNLDVLQRHIGNEVADLVYLDPPFKSNQEYNVLFAEHDGNRAAAQIKAFDDTWEWSIEAERACLQLIEGGGRVSQAMQAFRSFLGNSDMMAYLAMMTPRLVELRRVMKSSATIYLHCDPTASHYLKIIMDAIFGPENFRNEIVWRRTNARSTDKRWPRVHDVILMYSKTDTFFFKSLQVKADKGKLPHTLITVKGVKYQTYELTGPGATKEGDSGKPWRGFDPTKFGRHWGNAHEVMDAWADEGLIHFAKDGFPRRRDSEPFKEDDRVVTVADVWTDIDRINQSAKERLGYPTQKPEALLLRILEASCPLEGVVLDPFCGCGTTVATAQRTGRKWIGIDITHLAIGLIKSRLRDAFGDEVSKTYTVRGEPTTIEGGEQLAKDDPYQFQWWALGLVGARRVDEKKGADKGIDGRLYFHDEGAGGETKQIILSVKAGKLHANHIRDLRGVIEREKAEIGVLISLDEPTKPMRVEAASAGLYKSPQNQSYPRLQILTIGDILNNGKGIEYGGTKQTNVTVKKAGRAKAAKDDEKLKLF